MYLVVDVLEQTEHLGKFLEGLAKIGVAGTTVIDSIGMGRVLLQSGSDVAEIDVIKDVLAKGSPTNKTIFAVVKDKETADKAVDVVRSICGDLNEPGKGIVFTMPVDFAGGLAK